jgi:putative iron-regulated protein
MLTTRSLLHRLAAPFARWLTPARFTLAATLLALNATGCGDDDDASDTTGAYTDSFDTGSDAPSAEAKAAVVATYAAIAHASYADSLALAKTLQVDITAFLAAPDAATLTAARKSWLAARNAYGQTEAFRFFEGPIEEEGLEGRINAWPLDESYIDYVVGNDNAGVVNNPTAFPDITADLLAGLNEKGGETNIATGWHAIEFLLWGQDLSDTGPGDRQPTDFVTGKGGRVNADRRAKYLTVVTQLLVDDLTKVVGGWAPGVAGNFRDRFVKDVEGSLAAAFTGPGSLAKSELAGERMEVALDKRDQEDEHSCFSDNTLNDIRGNFRAVENVIRGQYTPVGPVNAAAGVVAVNGPGLLSLASDAEVAALDTALTAAWTSIAAIPAPFDQAILVSDRAASPITKAAADIRAVAADLRKLATNVGLTVSFDL